MKKRITLKDGRRNSLPSIKDEYDIAIQDIMAKDKKVEELHKLNEHVFEELMLLMDHKKTRKVAFCWIKKSKTNDYAKGIIILHGNVW